MRFPQLHKAAFTQPAIDNHAHPLLREAFRDSVPFEGLISEASGEALTQDAVHTMAAFRATKQLAALFGLDTKARENGDVSWAEVKAHRAGMAYTDLCGLCFRDAGIHCIFIDDGLGGVKEMAEEYKWHDRLTPARTKRIVRVEIEAEAILKEIFESYSDAFASIVRGQLEKSLTKSAEHPDVVGFKSIVCYRTGMNVKEEALLDVYYMLKEKGSIRLAHKALNDEVVRIALGVAGDARYQRYDGCYRAVQFHTGLGDSDITLALSSPAHLQPIIKKFKDTTFVLLHSSYPYTRDAGYLTAVYRNVYLDFGEVFPFVSGDGQRTIIRQVLELSPTNKICDGHWWPESYYLGVYQAREALFEVGASY
ncbi:amidohydrolase-domain-containing protein [Flammula alnicola]|nr:amidohydrolase-domain-containing protein [Flammula alnicola]